MSQAAAAALRAQKEKIVERWIAASLAEIHAARALDREAQVDSMPELLENLANALERGESVANRKESADIGKAHGRQRAEQKALSLNDVLVEYRLLSSAIFNVLRETIELERKTEDLINDAIHRGIGNASAEFVRVRSAQEQAARLVTGSLAEGICTIDRSGRITSLNPAAERLLDWPETELLGKHIDATVHAHGPGAATVAKESCRILKVLNTGVATRSYDDTFRRKDGSAFPVALSSSPIRQDGDVAGAAIAFHDISELKRVDEALKENQERLRRQYIDVKRLLAERVGELAAAQNHLRTLYEGVHDYAIFTLDPSGYITTWNHGAERMKQYTPDEAIGSHFSMLYPEEGNRRDEPMGHLRTAAIEGRFRGEGVRVKKSGELFLADVLITPMYQNSELVGFSKVVQDLTERNTLVQERDLSRTQARALETQQQLLERFVIELSHDIRTPLAAAGSSMEAITRSACNDTRHFAMAERAMNSVRRIDQLMTDLLDVSRIKAGQHVALQLQQCDLRKIAVEVADELTPTHGDRFVVRPTTPVIGYWDGADLKRVIENLCSNAAKYGEPETPVTISLEPVKDRVLLKVHNFGEVIPPEHQTLLFEPFRRGLSAADPRKKGWGLGLALVRGITEAHGGVVKVESYPKEGTTFTLDLPVDPRAADK
jgi:PAS domain S-box-containing protein